VQQELAIPQTRAGPQESELSQILHSQQVYSEDYEIDATTVWGYFDRAAGVRIRHRLAGGVALGGIVRLPPE
jgi:hypothetical protein